MCHIIADKGKDTRQTVGGQLLAYNIPGAHDKRLNQSFSGTLPAY